MEEPDDTSSSPTSSASGKAVRVRECDRVQLLDSHLTAYGIDVNSLSCESVLTEISLGVLLAIFRRCKRGQQETWAVVNRLFGKDFSSDYTRFSRFRRFILKKDKELKRGDVTLTFGEIVSDSALSLNEISLNSQAAQASCDQGDETQDEATTVVSEVKVEYQTTKIRSAKACFIRRRLRRAKKRISRLTADKKKLSSLLRTEKRRTARIQPVQCQCDSMKSQRTSAVILDLKQRISELEGIVVEARNEKLAVQTFSGGRYTDKMAECVLNLQMCSVADEQIPRVLKVVADLAGVKFDRVPSPPTCRNLSIAGLHLAKKHIGDKMEKVVNSGGSFCVQSDETTKGKRKMQAFGVGISGDDGSPRTLFLGLSHVAEKSSETAFVALQKKIATFSEDEGFVKKTFSAFTCAMSDRASTQVKFNSLIRAYRVEILPAIVSGWDSLSEDEKLRQKEFSEFFCQLHIISNLTDIVLEALAEGERIQSGRTVSKAQPTVLSVLKEAERWFGERSCGLYGVFPRWEAWCMEKGVEHYALPSFLGHRWNIVFLLAARIVYLLPHILQFINECGADKPELLELSGSLSDPSVVLHMQILGLVDQKITGPVWRLCEQSRHILETCAYASRLREWIQATLSDPVDFFSSSVFVTSNSPTDQVTGHLLKALVSIPPSETSLQVVLLVLSACDDYLSQVFADFLPNGKYYGRDDLSERTSCAPASNRSIESFFGLVSHLHSYSPNMRLVRMESQALLKKNSTMEWLASQPVHLRAELLKEARQNIKKLGQEASAEKQAVHNQILSLARAKKIQQEEKNVSEMRARARLTEAILVWGFWRTSVDMNMKLKDLTGTKQRAAMTAQIRFRQKVMMQPEPRPGLYKLTVNKGPCSIPELKTRLLELFEDDKMSVQVLSSAETDDLLGRTIRHRFKDDSGNPSEYEGRIESIERRGTGQPMGIIQYVGYDTPHSVSLVELRMGIENGDITFLDDPV